MISANFCGRDNACISNTAVQAASIPNRMALSLNKSNYAAELIFKSGVLTVSAISKSASFELFKRFGFRSGRGADKFAGADYIERAPNGTYRLKEHCVSYLRQGRGFRRLGKPCNVCGGYMRLRAGCARGTRHIRLLPQFNKTQAGRRNKKGVQVQGLRIFLRRRLPSY